MRTTLRCVLSSVILGLIPTMGIADTTLPSNTVVTMYTTQAYQFSNIHLPEYRIYHLDAVERLENYLSSQISSRPESAPEQLQRFFHTHNGARFKQQIQDAYVGVTQAWKTGVLKVPAIVFNENSSSPVVIYGETDVAKATKTYLQYLHQQNGK